MRARIFWFSLVIRWSSRFRRSRLSDWEYSPVSSRMSMDWWRMMYDIFSSNKRLSRSICA